MKSGWDEGQIELVGPAFGGFEVEADAVLFGDTADVAVFAGADEGEEVVGFDGHATFAEHGDGGFVDERFGVGEDPIHIEDDRGEVHGCGWGTREWVVEECGVGRGMETSPVVRVNGVGGRVHPIGGPATDMARRKTGGRGSGGLVVRARAAGGVGWNGMR